MISLYWHGIGALTYNSNVLSHSGFPDFPTVCVFIAELPNSTSTKLLQATKSTTLSTATQSHDSHVTGTQTQRYSLLMWRSPIFLSLMALMSSVLSRP